jgi:hypothetical protein
MSPFSALALVVGARRNRERGFRSRKKPDSTKKQDRTDGGQKKAASSRGQSLSFALYVGAGVTFRALSRLSTILHKWMVIEHKVVSAAHPEHGCKFRSWPRPHSQSVWIDRRSAPPSSQIWVAKASAPDEALLERVRHPCGQILIRLRNCRVK